jgi:hypothetical protein
MPARLTLHPELRPPLRWALSEERTYVLGREPGCDLVVDDERVSRRHARLWYDEGSWLLADLASKNGVSIGGFVTAEGRLDPGSWLSLGGVLGRLEPLDAETARVDSEIRELRWRHSAQHQARLDPLSDLQTLLAQILASVLELSGGERGFVLLSGASGLEVVAAAGLEDAELRRPDFAGSVGAVERALGTGRSIAVADVAIDLSLAARPSVLAGGIRALACVPLVALGRRLGAIYTDSRVAGSSFESLDLELLEAFAGHAALAIAAQRLDAELGRLAADLPRLAALPERAQAELERALVSVGSGSPFGERSRYPPAQVSSWSEIVAAHGGAGA